MKKDTRSVARDIAKGISEGISEGVTKLIPGSAAKGVAKGASKMASNDIDMSLVRVSPLNETSQELGRQQAGQSAMSKMQDRRDMRKFQEERRSRKRAQVPEERRSETKAKVPSGRKAREERAKKMAKGGSVSKRADGCAQRGKTRGKFV